MFIRLFAIFTVFVVLLSIVLGFLYLASPDRWNWQSVSDSFSLDTFFDSNTEASGTQPEIPLQNNWAGLTGHGSRPVSESNPVFGCVRTPSGPVTLLNSRPIYRWRDENGVISFSDTPPLSGDYELANSILPTRMDFFSISVDFRNQANIPFFQQRISANVTGIYNVLSGLVGLDYLRKVELDVVILPDRENYLAYSEFQTGVKLSYSSGFYTAATNEAVTYKMVSDETTLAVTQHESLHVIMQGVFGNTPHWLNEGLAEYFSKLSISGQVTRVEPDTDNLEQAQRAVRLGYPENLRAFFTMPRQEWDSQLQETNYALGWSMVYFLMSSTEGRRVMSTLLEALSESYCDSIDSALVLSRAYPGGLTRFESRFQGWLAESANKDSHIF